VRACAVVVVADFASPMRGSRLSLTGLFQEKDRTSQSSLGRRTGDQLGRGRPIQSAHNKERQIMNRIGPTCLLVCLALPGFDAAAETRELGSQNFIEPGADDERRSDPRAESVSVDRDGYAKSNNEEVRLAAVPAVGKPNTGELSDDQRSRRGIEEIIVTAQKRAERLQDVPVSIAVVSAEDIDQRGLFGAEDYLRGIPSINQMETSYGGQTIIIRGMETTTAFQNNGGGPTTATYFGETPTTNSAGLLGSSIDIKLVDIERVEVLRGPQGTAFGNSSLGGAVRVIPVQPSLSRYEGKVAAGYSVTSDTGGDNGNFQLIGNAPLVKDRLAVRAVGYQYNESGFYRNRAGSDALFQSSVVDRYGADSFAVDKDEIGAYYVIGGRVATLWQPIDNLRFTVSYLTQKSETDGFPLANDGLYQQTFLQVAPEHVRRGQAGGFTDNNIDMANAQVEYDLGWASLLGTYSYIKGGTTHAVPFPAAFGLVWPASIGAVDNNRGQIGEVRLASQLSGAWNFLVGIYAEDQEDKDDRTFLWHGDPATNPVAPGGRFLGSFLDTRDLTQNAAFGEVSWKFLPSWQLDAGARLYEYERVRTVDQDGPLLGGFRSTRADQDASGTNFRGSLSYKPVEDMLLYARWAQGFRLGRPLAPPANALLARCDKNADGVFDGTNIAIQSTTRLASDEVDSYELGGKFTLMERRMTIEAAVFRIDWTNVPVLLSLPPVNPDCPFSYNANAGKAVSKGVEFSAAFRPTDVFQVDLGASWIDAALTEDVPAQGFSAGDRLPGSPEVNANLGLQYEIKLGRNNATVRTDAIYVGSFYGNVLPLEAFKAGDYVKLDATVRLEVGSFDFDVFVNNLTDEDAYTSRAVNPTREEFYGYRLRPRTIGLRLGYSF
jgi:iron complex outermembrane recepter protein